MKVRVIHSLDSEEKLSKIKRIINNHFKAMADENEDKVEEAEDTATSSDTTEETPKNGEEEAA